MSGKKSSGWDVDLKLCDRLERLRQKATAYEAVCVRDEDSGNIIAIECVRTGIEG